MGATPTDREQPSPRDRPGRVASRRARLIRAAGAARRRWPRVALGLRRYMPDATWRRLRAGEPERMAPLHLWLILLLVAITLAAGLATLAQVFHLV